jgi:hypothetical protein
MVLVLLVFIFTALNELGPILILNIWTQEKDKNNTCGGGFISRQLWGPHRAKMGLAASWGGSPGILARQITRPPNLAPPPPHNPGAPFAAALSPRNR